VGLRVVDIRGLWMDRHHWLASLRLAHILMMSLIVSFLLLNSVSNLQILIKRLFWSLLLNGKVSSAVRNLLWLIVLLRRQTLDQLIVLLDLLLVVLHWLQLQVHRASIFKNEIKSDELKIFKVAKFKYLATKIYLLWDLVRVCTLLLDWFARFLTCWFVKFPFAFIIAFL